MPDRVRVVSASSGGAGRGVPLGLVVGVLIAIVAGFVFGRTTVPSSHTTRTVTSTTAVNGEPAPSRVADGVSRGYPDTEAGAVAALLADGQNLANPSVLFNPSRRSQVLSLIATSQYASTFSGSGGQALNQAEKQSPLGRGIASGAQTVYLSVPVAYRVTSYTSQRITVVGYGVSVVANDQGLSPRATWATNTTTAVWQDGDWKVASASSVDGPTPAPTDQPSSASTFLNALTSAREVHDAP